MLDAFDRCFDSRVTRTEPDGGLFVGVPCLRAVIPSRCRVRRRAGVLVVPGAGFMTDPETISRSFRLNYSTPSDEAFSGVWRSWAGSPILCNSMTILEE